MAKKGVCTLRGGALFTGVLACVYNGLLINWFWKSLMTVNDEPPNSEVQLLLQALLGVVMSLAAVHIVISLFLIYGTIKEKPDLVMLWVLMYVSSCVVVASMFTIGLAFIYKKIFLYIIFCNFLFIFNIVITFRYYKKMTMKSNREDV